VHFLLRDSESWFEHVVITRNSSLTLTNDVSTVLKDIGGLSLACCA
jgi:hypothetical protein